MAKRMYYSSPHRYKKDAQKKANELRKKGQKVRVTPADLYSKSRGYKWDVKVVGVRKRKFIN